MKKIWCLSWNFVNFKAIIRGTYWFDFNYPKQEFSVRKLEEVYTCIWDKKKNPNVLSENFFFTNDCLNLILMFVQKCKLNML